MNKLCTIVAAAAFITGSASASLMYASGVANFSQGLTKGGGAVSADRTITSKALGAPQINDTMNFVSLGFGGSIILTFDSTFGGSVTVWETTYGSRSSYREAAEIFVGFGSDWNTASYYSVGQITNATAGVTMSLSQVEADSGRQAFNFLKIVDATNPALHNNSADGFDVDGVGAELRTVPAPGGVALAAVLGLGAMRRRRPN